MFTQTLPRPWLIFFFLMTVGLSGWRPLWDPDEGRYAETAREMAAGGDWLIPHLEGRPHLTKPPFTYWTTAIGLKVFGVNAWGARLPHSFAFFLLILVVGELAMTWGWSERESRMAALIFATSAVPYAAGRVLTTDVFLTLWETLGVLCAWNVWRGSAKADGGGGAGRWRVGLWLAFGMAFLTKGPPGLLPAAAIVAFAFSKPGRAGRPRLWSAAGLVGFLIVGGGWYLAVSVKQPGLLSYFVKDEVYGRVFTDEHKRDHPWFIYPVILSVGVLPWIFLYPSFLRKALAKRRAGWAAMSDLERFSILWFFVPLAVFLAAKSRMIFYVLPLFVPIALWMGRLAPPFMDRLGRLGRGWRRAVVAGAGVCSACYLLLSVGPAWFPGSRTDKLLAESVLKALGPNPGPVAYIWINNDPFHTAAFYLGRVTESIEDIDYDDMDALNAQWLRERGGRIVYLSKVSRMERILHDVSGVTELARDERAVAFEVNPHPAELAPGRRSAPAGAGAAAPVPAVVPAASANPAPAPVGPSE